MPISFCVLASGSSGNCIWVRGGGAEVLVDCGLSARETARRLSTVGLEMDRIEAAVCSHGHGDHVCGAAVLARRFGLKIHATTETLGLIRGDPPKSSLCAIPRAGSFRIKGLSFTTFATLHDAPGSVALVIDDGETRLGVVTDLGVVTEGLVRGFQGLDGLVLESNHDEDMLEGGPYPYFLKKRIAGVGGHLSNRQAGDLLGRLAHPGLQQLTLAHLSEENNRPEKALAVAEGVLAAAGAKARVTVAGAHTVAEPVDLECRGQLPLAL